LRNLTTPSSASPIIEVPAHRDQYVASLFLTHTDAPLFPKVKERRRLMSGQRREVA